jgi:hypothetical protein
MSLAGSVKVSDKFSPQFLVYGGEDTPTQVGVNLSGLIGEAAVVYDRPSAALPPWARWLRIGALPVAGVVNGVLLTPLHYPESGRILSLNTLWKDTGRQGARRGHGAIAVRLGRLPRRIGIPLLR